MTHLVCLSVYPQIFRAMQRQMFKYDTFRRHARTYIEPAIIHTWKTVQDGMMEQRIQQGSVILGGDLRADSPGIQDSLDTFYSNVVV